MLNKLHLLVCLFAAIVITIFNLINQEPLERATINLIATIVLFYLLGLAVKYYLSKQVFPVEESAENAEDTIEAETAEEIAEEADMEIDKEPEDTDSAIRVRERKPRKPVASLTKAED